MGKAQPFWAQYAATIDRRRLGAIAVLLLGASLLAVFLAPAKARQIENAYTPVSSSSTVFEPSSFNFDPSEDNSRSENRSFYPYSVIPGGAKTAVELRNAVANDAVVRAHYAGFVVANTHLERLEKPQAFYVSYRIGNAIFWTKNALTLPAGERVLTDGSNMARTRCGNRLSVTPAAPVSNVEPSPEAMEAPAGGVLLASIATPAELLIMPPPATMIAPVPGAAPPASEFSPPFVPFFPFIPGGAPPPSRTPGTPTPPIIPPPPGPTPPASPPLAPPPATPPVATPEPSVVLLLAAGLSCLLSLKKLR
jgi:hypothetical protein